jgi:hypothetical protein
MMITNHFLPYLNSTPTPTYLFGEKEVGSFDIPVQDPTLVKVVQCLGELCYPCLQW